MRNRQQEITEILKQKKTNSRNPMGPNRARPSKGTKVRDEEPTHEQTLIHLLVIIFYPITFKQ